MSDYTKATNFTAKDSLASGDPSKLIKGSEIDDEYDAIAVAVATKQDETTVPHTYLTSVSGTNTIAATGTVTPAVGVVYTLIPANSNTGAATLNVSSFGAGAIKLDGQALAGGELKQNVPATLLCTAATPVFEIISAGNYLSKAIGGSIAGNVTLSNGDLTLTAGMLKLAKGADVASGTALPLLTDGNFFHVTGNTAIETFDSVGAGTIVFLKFDSTPALTHHATNLILPTGANITAAAGDTAAFVEYASGDVRCLFYQRADGSSLSAAPASQGSSLVLLASSDVSAAASLSLDGYFSSTYKKYVLEIFDYIPANDNTQCLLQFNIAGSPVTASYQHAARRSLAGGGSTDAVSGSDSGIRLSGDLSNGVTDPLSTTVNIYLPLSTTAYKKVTFSSAYGEGSSQAGMGTYRGATTALSGITLKQEAGNITSAYVRLYGVKDA